MWRYWWRFVRYASGGACNVNNWPERVPGPGRGSGFFIKEMTSLAMGC
jgi:hypothetical protein